MTRRTRRSLAREARQSMRRRWHIAVEGGGGAVLPPLLIPSSAPPVHAVPSAASSAEAAAVAAANAAAAAAVAIEAAAAWDATASSSLDDESISTPHLASLAAALSHPVTTSPSSGEASSSGELADESHVEEEHPGWMGTSSSSVQKSSGSALRSDPTEEAVPKPSPTHDDEEAFVSSRRKQQPPPSVVMESPMLIGAEGPQPTNGIDSAKPAAERAESIEAAALAAAFTAALEGQEDEAAVKGEKRYDWSSEAACDARQQTETDEQQHALKTARGSPGGTEVAVEVARGGGCAEQSEGSLGVCGQGVGSIPSSRETEGDNHSLNGIGGFPLRSAIPGKEEKKKNVTIAAASSDQDKPVVQSRRRWFFRDSIPKFDESAEALGTQSGGSRRLKESLAEGCNDSDEALRSRQARRSFPESMDECPESRRLERGESNSSSRARSYSSVARSGSGKSDVVPELSDSSRRMSPNATSRQSVVGRSLVAEDDAAEFDGAGVCGALWRHKKASAESSPEKQRPLCTYRSRDGDLNDNARSARSCRSEDGTFPGRARSASSQSLATTDLPTPAPPKLGDAATTPVLAATAMAGGEAAVTSTNPLLAGTPGGTTEKAGVADMSTNEVRRSSRRDAPLNGESVGGQSLEKSSVVGGKAESLNNPLGKGQEKTPRRHLFSRLWRREVWPPSQAQPSPLPAPAPPELRPSSSSFFSWSPAVASSSSSTAAATVEATDGSEGCPSASWDALSPVAVRSVSCSDLKDRLPTHTPSLPSRLEQAFPARRKGTSCGLEGCGEYARELRSDSGQIHEESRDSGNSSSEIDASSPSYFLCEEVGQGQAVASGAGETDRVSQLSPSSRRENTWLSVGSDRCLDECEFSAPLALSREDDNRHRGIAVEGERTARCSPLTCSRSSSVGPEQLRTQESFRSLEEGAASDKQPAETEA